MVPRTGNISIHIVASANEPKENARIFSAYTRGWDVFKEEWLPRSGETNISVQGVDTSQRIKTLEAISVEDGEFLGIRIQNLSEGFGPGLCAIYIEYH